MRKDFEIEVLGLGHTTGEYPGQFTKPTEMLIKFWLNKSSGKVLHLFSGISTIGDVRVDIDNLNATIKDTVENYLVNSQENFEWVILDPPYLVNASNLKQGYTISRPFSCSVPQRRIFEKWAKEHAKFIIWLDLCAPLPQGFKREKLYFLLPGGYGSVRVLSILKNVEK